MTNQSTNKLDLQEVKPASLPSTDRSLPIALTRAREKVMLPIRQMLLASGITEQQWRILRVLHEQGPLDSTSLAEQSCILMPSLTRIVQSMEEKGFVSRVASAQDRRRQKVSIKKKGRDIIERNLDEAAVIAKRFEDVLGKQKLKALLETLKQLDEL